MALKLYDEDSVIDIADAIRTKLDTSERYRIADMAAAILSISGGGTGVVTGTVTPAARENQISIDIGMTSINGFIILCSSESPWKSQGRTMGGLIIIKNPAPYWKRIALESNTAGSAALAPSLSTTVTSETISGTVLTVPNMNYAYETIEYRWYAW